MTMILAIILILVMMVVVFCAMMLADLGADGVQPVGQVLVAAVDDVDVAQHRGAGRGQHAEQDRNLVALGTLDPAQYVLLGDVGEFVADDRCEFALVLGGENQAGIDRDVAAEGGQGAVPGSGGRSRGRWRRGGGRR